MLARPRYDYKNYLASPRISALMNGLAPSSSSYSGRISPSGRLSIGYVPPARLREKDIRYEAARGHWVYSLRCHWHYLHGYQSEVVKREVEPEKLGLSIVPNCRTETPRRYGLLGMTSNGRNRVYDGAYLLHRAYPRRLGFYTLTCPYTDVQDIYLYNQNIGYILRSYFEEVKREYARLSVPWSYVSVLEYQDSRYDESGIPVLHVHYVAPCYRPGKWDFVLSADEIRSLWGRVCRRVLSTEVSVAASVDAVVVKTSASNYLAKYLSKGGKTTAYLSHTCPDQVPKQWWSMSKNVRDCIKNNTVELADGICERILFASDNPVDGCIQFVYSQRVYVNIAGQERQVGFFGQLTNRERELWITLDLDVLRKVKLVLTSSDELVKLEGLYIVKRRKLTQWGFLGSSSAEANLYCGNSEA